MIEQLKALGLDPYEGLTVTGQLAEEDAIRAKNFLLGVADLEGQPVDSALSLTVEGNFSAIKEESVARRVRLCRWIVTLDLILPPTPSSILDLNFQYGTNNFGQPAYTLDAGVIMGAAKVTAPSVYQKYAEIAALPFDNATFGITIDSYTKQFRFRANKYEN
jgi:hypothetical protein